MIKQQNFAQDMHVKKVLAWRENLALMPDSHFFELIRMYLGEVKTPYNKHKLIEELSSFLRKAENQQNLVIEGRYIPFDWKSKLMTSMILTSIYFSNNFL